MSHSELPAVPAKKPHLLPHLDLTAKSAKSTSTKKPHILPKLDLSKLSVRPKPSHLLEKKERPPNRFHDADIQRAFRECDVDKNGYIGG